ASPLSLSRMRLYLRSRAWPAIASPLRNSRKALATFQGTPGPVLAPRAVRRARPTSNREPGTDLPACALYRDCATRRQKTGVPAPTTAGAGNCSALAELGGDFGGEVHRFLLDAFAHFEAREFHHVRT